MQKNKKGVDFPEQTDYYYVLHSGFMPKL